jgi:hypothetical protein
MTATTVAVRARGTTQKVWRCNYCATGHHGSCPGAIWHQRKVSIPETTDTEVVPTLWRCQCKEPGHPDFPYCTACKHNRAEDINPDLWRCVDAHACATRVEVRRQNSPLWQKIERAKSHAALKRKAAKSDFETVVAGVPADQDELIDRMHAMLDSLSGARKTRGPGRKRVVKPKSGKCECCGEPTRGGRFLPGHDAKLVSRLVEKIRAGDREAYEEMKRRNWLKKIPAKVRSALVIDGFDWADDDE